MTEQLPQEQIGDPPCDHDAYTPCPPECAEAKAEWRRRAAAAIAREQNAPLPQDPHLSASQRRVLSLVDNGRSATHDTSDRNAFVGRMRTIRSLQNRGMLDGYDLTEKGRVALYYYRDRSRA